MLSLEDLKDCLKAMENKTKDECLGSLSERKKKELEFHDFYLSHRDRLELLDKETFNKSFSNTKYYVAADLSKNYADQWLSANVKDKIFLDYACGRGTNAVKAVQFGAKFSIGIDISSKSIETAKAFAAESGVQERTFFVQADCEDTKLPDQSIDIIICSGMLHHLDLSYAFPELRRIMKPGGKILAIEALNCNPFIQLYRYMTPKMRTKWEAEHILGLRDVEFAKRFFDVGEIRYWHIASILGRFMKHLLPIFQGIDKVLTRIPIIQLMAWMFTFELNQRENTVN